MFEAMPYVMKHKFIAIKGQWVEGIESEGLVCVYAPLKGNEKVTFFLSFCLNLLVDGAARILLFLRILMLC